MPAHTAAGSSKSKPGSTTAPEGVRATRRISSAVAPREPVEPATTMGWSGGARSQSRV